MSYSRYRLAARPTLDQPAGRREENRPAIRLGAAYSDFGDAYFVVDRWHLAMNRLRIVARQDTVPVDPIHVVSAWWIGGRLAEQNDVLGLLLARLIQTGNPPLDARGAVDIGLARTW